MVTVWKPVLRLHLGTVLRLDLSVLRLNITPSSPGTVLRLDILSFCSPEEVKQSVGTAVSKVVDPIKSKVSAWMVTVRSHDRHMLLTCTQEEYVGHLQSQIKDLERYIVFLQAKQVSTPTTPNLEDPPTTSLSHDSPRDPTTPEDARRSHGRPTISLAKPSRGAGGGKRVTFARETWDGRFEDPPTPQYRLSMAQLDGVDCVVDSTRCEWEKMDSLGKALPKEPRVRI